MYQSKHYANTPLKEAIIDIGIKSSDILTLDMLNKMSENFKEDYPQQHEQRQIIVEDQSALSDVTELDTQTVIGYEYLSKDGKQILRIRADGFSFSRLLPYDTWETFSYEAIKLWKFYRSIVQPKVITRAAVRYISEFALPITLDDLREYLRTVPEVSPDIPQPGLSSYFLQLQIPQEDLEASLVINQTMLPINIDSQIVSVVLDIDIFRQGNLPFDDEGLWNFFEELRNRKNQVFEACITDKLRELIS